MQGIAEAELTMDTLFFAVREHFRIVQSRDEPSLVEELHSFDEFTVRIKLVLLTRVDGQDDWNGLVHGVDHRKRVAVGGQRRRSVRVVVQFEVTF